MQWLNSILPYLKLPPKASEDELMLCLVDGTVLCNILNTLSPGSVEVVGLTSFPFDLFIFFFFFLFNSGCQMEFMSCLTYHFNLYFLL